MCGAPQIGKKAQGAFKATGKIAWLLLQNEVTLLVVAPSFWCRSLPFSFLPLHLYSKPFNRVEEQPTIFHSGFSMAKQQGVAGVVYESVAVEIDHAGL